MQLLPRLRFLALVVAPLLWTSACVSGPIDTAREPDAAVALPSASVSAGSLAEDIREATAHWARQGGNYDSLRQDLQRTALEYGVDDWARNPVTYRAIGEGLRESALRDAALESVKDTLATGHPQALTWINMGYYAGRN